MFRIGERIVLFNINSIDGSYLMTGDKIGETYEVLDLENSDGCIKVGHLKSGRYFWGLPQRFHSIKTIRKQKLKRICSKQEI